MASNNNTIVDFKYMSKGGLLIDSSGDIAFTDNSSQSLQDMIVTRLESALNGFKLYPIGADLEKLVGKTVSNELEVAIQKQVTQSLSYQFLPIGSFTVTTIAIANSIVVYVYLQQTLIATTTVTTH